ncbi:MAG: hypothetical protein IH977_11830 [Nitrospinae bacterium]|nr:hypothetical protein [Nitrospinota bacterium]
MTLPIDMIENDYLMLQIPLITSMNSGLRILSNMFSVKVVAEITSWVKESLIILAKLVAQANVRIRDATQPLKA